MPTPTPTTLMRDRREAPETAAPAPAGRRSALGAAGRIAFLAAMAVALPLAAQARIDGPEIAPMRPTLVQGKGQAPAPTPAQPASDDPSFRLTNRGTTTINEVYVSSTRTDDWGEDRLGDDVLEPGQSVIIRLPRGECMNDIRIVFDDDTAQERRRVDTCALTDVAFP